MVTITPMPRVCIVNTSAPEFLARISEPSLRTNDIVLMFDHDRRALVRIDGFLSRLTPISQDMNQPIDPTMVGHRLTDPMFDQQSFTARYRWLTPEEWNGLRPAILYWNPGLEALIASLEAAQRPSLGHVSAEDAVLFEGVQTAIEIFNPPGVRSIAYHLNGLRQNLEPTMPITPKRIAQTLINGQMAEPMAPETGSFFATMQGRYIKGFQEAESIQHDFVHAPPGWEQAYDNIDPMARHAMVQLRDPDTRRSLVLLMAHRQGPDQRDLVGADLIYDTVSHKSLVFVQYKRLSDVGTIQPAKLDPDQLQTMLDICRHHDCHCGDGPNALDHMNIRLGDCPMYYKLLAHAPKIDDDCNRMEGNYLQACLLQQSLPLLPKERKAIIARGVPHRTFYELIRRSQIGSRAGVYEQFHRAIERFGQIPAGIPAVYAQETAW